MVRPYPEGLFFLAFFPLLGFLSLLGTVPTEPNPEGFLSLLGLELWLLGT